MFKARKIYRNSNFRERMEIKTFKDSDALHRFLNKKDNSWQVYDGDLPTGLYAMVTQQWRNVNKLDISVLAHV